MPKANRGKRTASAGAATRSGDEEGVPSGSCQGRKKRAAAVKAAAKTRKTQQPKDDTDSDSDFEVENSAPNKKTPKAEAKATATAKGQGSKAKKTAPAAAASKETTPNTREGKKAVYAAKLAQHAKDADTEIEISKGQKMWGDMGMVSGRAEGRFSHRAFERGVGRSAVCGQLSQMRVCKSVMPFSRRVTALEWHPREPTVCAMASKGGGVVVWNYTKDQFDWCLDTDHAGGSIQTLKFDFHNPRKIYSCSIDGTFMARVFGEGTSRGTTQVQTFLDTGANCVNNWYTSFDVSFSGKTMLAGSNLGKVTLLTQDRGEQIWQEKLHKSKVSFIRFSPREPWLFVTASIDHTVKIWDIRMLRSGATKNNCLQSLDHEKGVNNAEFSQVDGSRLVTTDQHSQVRVYRSPHWTLERVLPHPHRQFQHLTPVKAGWHPMVDLVVAGRYPDKAFPGTPADGSEPRSVDFFDVDSGAIVHQLVEAEINKIMSLNVFSPWGDAMLSSAGLDILLWKQKPDNLEVEFARKSSQGVLYDEWPGYKPQPKARTKKSAAP